MMSSTRESLCMCDLCRKRAAAYARTEAFAAIRRAAAVARDWDRVAEVGKPATRMVALASAITVRYAIRAAIGLDKT